MMAIEIILAAALVACLCGAVVSAIVPPRRVGRILAVFGSTASLLLLVGATGIIFMHTGVTVQLWRLPILGALRLHVGGVSAFFMLALGISFLAACIFSDGYMRRYDGHYDTRAFGIFFHMLLFVSIVLLSAGDLITFLLAWRIMSGLATFPIALEHRISEHRRSAYLFLAMNEAGIIVAMVGLLWMAALAGGHIGFPALHQAMGKISPAIRWTLFIIIFFGFAVKAGLIPVSSWLPRAHPVAPANMSAILSGCLLNFGIYGIVRFDAIILPPIAAGPGLLVLIVGTISALVGILYAAIDNDMKKMLAHSSTENLGIVTADIGMGMVFSAYHLPALAAIAYLVAMYHMINHSVYKTLLFIGAGTVDQQVGSRNMNQLGGMIKRMPLVAALFLIGALAIAAVPPLNGFVSEWLTLQTVLRSENLASHLSRVIFGLCGAGLALTAALAVTCFVKAFAMSFLGRPRTAMAAKAAAPARSAAAAMFMLAVICVILGLGVTWVIPGINSAMNPLTKSLAARALVPPFFHNAVARHPLPAAFENGFAKIGARVGADIIPARGLVVMHRTASNGVVYAMSTFYMAAVLVIIIFITWLAVRIFSRRRRIISGEPWAGGIRRLTPDMSYSATGFSNPIRVIFRSIFRPAIRENSNIAVAGHFRTAIKRERDDGYLVDRLFLQPIVASARWASAQLARLHRPAVVNAYAGWLFLALLLLLLINRIW
ncbi:MAG: proton-conducting transporter membrane subunit [Phycisphaerae bacterium]